MPGVHTGVSTGVQVDWDGAAGSGAIGMGTLGASIGGRGTGTGATCAGGMGAGGIYAGAAGAGGFVLVEAAGTEVSNGDRVTAGSCGATGGLVI
ncbi:MAG TPA: hypothetical protein VGS16_04880 [Candidatus Dormibacteraeota bacterium]|nr:hypothetical protein [Candidatus Dormibacteraeota bacterium]